MSGLISVILCPAGQHVSVCLADARSQTMTQIMLFRILLEVALLERLYTDTPLQQQRMIWRTRLGSRSVLLHSDEGLAPEGWRSGQNLRCVVLRHFILLILEYAQFHSTLIHTSLRVASCNGGLVRIPKVAALTRLLKKSAPNPGVQPRRHTET